MNMSRYRKEQWLEHIRSDPEFKQKEFQRVSRRKLAAWHGSGSWNDMICFQMEHLGIPCFYYPQDIETFEGFTFHATDPLMNLFVIQDPNGNIVKEPNDLPICTDRYQCWEWIKVYKKKEG